MNSIATPEALVGAAILVTIAGILLLTMVGFMIRSLIRDHAGVILLRYHPLRVRRTPGLADRKSLELASRRLQNVVFQF